MALPRLVGITVMPEYFQSESVDGVLDRLQRLAGVTAVTTSPYVMAPADRQTGFREPPIDAGAGKVRLLDRTLWGKRELWARTAPSFRPNLDLYRGLRYQPPAADDLTREQGPLVGEFIFNRMRSDAAALYRRLHGGLTDGDLRICAEADSLGQARRRLLPAAGGLEEWTEFKVGLVESLHAGFRQAMNEAGGQGMELRPNAFPPPWNLFSGLDYGRVSPYCSALSVKLYTMHWPMMLRFYGDRLHRANPGVSERLLARALARLFDTGQEPPPARLKDFRYPSPEEPHPVGEAAQHRKIAQAQLEAGSTPVCTLAHAYGPATDFRSRLRTARSASRHGFWINRYGHLSDEKLAVVGEVARRA